MGQHSFNDNLGSEHNFDYLLSWLKRLVKQFPGLLTTNKYKMLPLEKSMHNSDTITMDRLTSITMIQLTMHEYTRTCPRTHVYKRAQKWTNIKRWWS